MSDEASDSTAQTAASPLPGALLREAREAKGLTVAEVASAIKFHPRQIEAIERDDYEQLRGRTFLRGFVRAYARALQLDADPLLDMLDHAIVFREEVVVPPDNMGETNPRPFYIRHARQLLVATMVVVAVAGIGLAYLNADLQAFLSRSSTSVAAANSAAVEASEVSMTPVTIADVGNTMGVSSTAAPAADASGTVTVAPEAVLSATAAQPGSMLEFQFSALSWLEVKDASGKVLVTGEIPAGQKRGVDGTPPFDLWIGKASAVKVTYKGQPIDVMPYAHDEVARLTLN